MAEFKLQYSKRYAEALGQGDDVTIRPHTIEEHATALEKAGLSTGPWAYTPEVVASITPDTRIPFTPPPFDFLAVEDDSPTYCVGCGENRALSRFQGLQGEQDLCDACYEIANMEG